jgi:hypothetical protein
MNVPRWILDYDVWLNPIVLLVGLGIAIWAFLRCRKQAYLLFAAYFALAVVLPPINRVYRKYQAPHYSQQTQNEMQTAIDQAIEKVIAERGYPHQPVIRNIYFPFGSILLVVGLGLLAKREPHQPTAPEPTPIPSRRGWLVLAMGFIDAVVMSFLIPSINHQARSISNWGLALVLAGLTTYLCFNSFQTRRTPDRVLAVAVGVFTVWIFYVYLRTAP